MFFKNWNNKLYFYKIYHCFHDINNDVNEFKCVRYKNIYIGGDYFYNHPNHKTNIFYNYDIKINISKYITNDLLKYNYFQYYSTTIYVPKFIPYFLDKYYLKFVLFRYLHDKNNVYFVKCKIFD